MSQGELSLEETLKLLDILASESLPLWDQVPEGATARLINVSENATYLVSAPGWKSILRIHRENYHTRTAIQCELAWSTDLNDNGGVSAPGFYLGSDGNAIQQGIVDGLPAPRFMVMFEFVEGVQPDESHDLVASFGQLGEIAARTHEHSTAWARPADFERLVWDLDTVFGPDATWGNWRDAPNVTPEIAATLQRVEDTVTRRLKRYGRDASRFGLIHADMRLANLLVDDAGNTRLIDFDDCGLGWFMYDFAAGISFMEDHPQVPDMKDAWVEGYRKVRPLSAAEEHEIESFIMLRRLALLAWIGSHIEAPEPQEMAPHFARVSAELGAKYLATFGQD